jgi:hypothetical protein
MRFYRFLLQLYPTSGRVTNEARSAFVRHAEGRRPEGSRIRLPRCESGIVTAVGLPLVAGSLRSG